MLFLLSSSESLMFTSKKTKNLYIPYCIWFLGFKKPDLILNAEVNRMAKGRCMKCRKEVEIKDGKEVTMKNGMKAMKGVCGTCGTKVFRILGKAK